MKRNVKKKLTLHRETILALGNAEGGKTGVSTPLSACVPTACGTACLGCSPDSTPDNGCMPSLEVPCEEPISRYC